MPHKSQVGRTVQLLEGRRYLATSAIEYKSFDSFRKVVASDHIESRACAKPSSAP